MLTSFAPFANAIGLPDETFAPALSGGGANAIEKALMILMVLVRQDRPLGTVQISRMTGFHKATTSRILTTLERFGLVVQNDRSRKYVIGPLGYQMGATQLSQSMRAIAQHIYPRLLELRDHFAATLILELWAGRHSVVAAIARPADKKSCAVSVGDARPLCSSTGGLAVLAQMSPKRVEKFLSPLEQSGVTAALPANMCISSEIARIRTQGYVLQRSDGGTGQMQLAVALQSPEGVALGALTLVQENNTDAYRALHASAATLAHMARRMREDLGEMPLCPLEAWHHDHV